MHLCVEDYGNKRGAGGGGGENEREREKQIEILCNITMKISLFIIAVLRRILISVFAVRISLLAFEIGSSFPVRLRWIID